METISTLWSMFTFVLNMMFWITAGVVSCVLATVIVVGPILLICNYVYKWLQAHGVIEIRQDS